MIRLKFFLLLQSFAFSILCYGQAIDPNKSARAIVANENQFVGNSISFNEGMVFLSQKGVDKGADERVKELAQTMLENYTSMLYSMEQLQVAGKGASEKQQAAVEDAEAFAIANEKMTPLKGPTFDSVWVAHMLPIEEKRYNEMTQAKETVTNGRLKMAITEAIPMMRKHLSQLKSVQKHLIRIATQKRKEEAAREREREAKVKGER